jgi:hypothetical protein
VREFIVRGLVGFTIACVLIPGLNGGFAYWYHSHLTDERVGSLSVAVLVSLPLILSGLRDWWDVWVFPYPKLGAPWRTLIPRNYYIGLFRSHGLALAICLVIHLVSNHFIAAKKFEPSTLNVAETKAWLANLEREIAKERGEWEPAWVEEELKKFPEVTKRAVWVERGEKRIDVLLAAKEYWIKQLADHEKQVNFLAQKTVEQPDKYTRHVISFLIFAACFNTMGHVKKRQFASGQPIERG